MKKPVRFIKLTFSILVVLAIGSYAYYQMQGYLKGPILTLVEPLNNSTLYQEDVLIKGYAKNISYISMNGRQIFTDPDGQFSEELLLSQGFNIIEVIVKDKYERKNQQILKLVYLEKNS